MKDIKVYDSDLNLIYLIEDYVSFIWTERYNECGDFELEIPLNIYNKNYIKTDNFLSKTDTDRIMVIEKIEFSLEEEGAQKITLSGRSAESLLDRRIIWKQKSVENVELNTFIKTILNENVISPTDSYRTISLINYIENTNINAYKKVTAQYNGDNILTVIENLCQDYGLGFKMVKNGQKLDFSIYEGNDLSTEQSFNDYVIFSDLFDSILTSSYAEDYTDYKNAILIAGTGDGSSKKYASVGNEYTGLTRRETFLDQSSLKNVNESGTTLADSVYLPQLQTKGREELLESSNYKMGEGELNRFSKTFEYRISFNIGDIVQIVDRFLNSYNGRITEYIYNYEDSGENAYPTFTAMDNTKYSTYFGLGITEYARDKWYFRRYASGAAYPTTELLSTLTPDAYNFYNATADNTSIFSAVTDNYRAWVQCFVYVEKETAWNGSFKIDDSGILYVNDVEISRTSYNPATSFSTTLRKGWNKIDVTLQEGTGQDFITFVTGSPQLIEGATMMCCLPTGMTFPSQFKYGSVSNSLNQSNVSFPLEQLNQNGIFYKKTSFNLIEFWAIYNTNYIAYGSYPVVNMSVASITNGFTLTPSTTGNSYLKIPYYITVLYGKTYKLSYTTNISGTGKGYIKVYYYDYNAGNIDNYMTDLTSTNEITVDNKTGNFDVNIPVKNANLIRLEFGTDTKTTIQWTNIGLEEK